MVRPDSEPPEDLVETQAIPTNGMRIPDATRESVFEEGLKTIANFEGSPRHYRLLALRALNMASKCEPTALRHLTSKQKQVLDRLGKGFVGVRYYTSGWSKWDIPGVTGVSDAMVSGLVAGRCVDITDSLQGSIRCQYLRLPSVERQEDGPSIAAPITTHTEERFMQWWNTIDATEYDSYRDIAEDAWNAALDSQLKGEGERALREIDSVMSDDHITWQDERRKLIAILKSHFAGEGN